MSFIREFLFSQPPSVAPADSGHRDPDTDVRMFANHRAEKAVKTVIGRRVMNSRRVS